MKRKRINHAPKSAPSPLGLSAELWLTAGGHDLGGPGRIALLAAIDSHGSITQAAKAVGMSYKAAWEAVATMGNLAGEPLVSGAAGGHGGGSTHLTPLGARLVVRFYILAGLHQRYLKLLSAEGVDLDADVSLLRTLNLRTSARNQFMGTVHALRQGAVNDEVELKLAGGTTTLVALVTRESTAVMQLKVGMTAFALIKSSSVLIAAEMAGARLSARNQLAGEVQQVTHGAVNSEVVLRIDGGHTLAATITRTSAETLQLTPGSAATALFKASSVIVGVPA